MLDGKKVGNAYIDTNGLYTSFQCKCSFPIDGIYRINAKYGVRYIDLGVCIPNGDSYVTSAKIPTKNLGEEEPAFYAIRKGSENLIFIAVDEHTDFRYLKRLVDARFQVQNGQKGLLIRDNQ